MSLAVLSAPLDLLHALAELYVLHALAELYIHTFVQKCAVQQPISLARAGPWRCSLWSFFLEYSLSEEFQKTLAPSTQAEYRRMLTKAEAAFGDMPIVALDDPRVKKEFLDWRESVARESGYREANHRLSAISAMLTWAVDRGRLTINHVKGFRRVYHSDRSEIIWLPEHVRGYTR